MMMTPYVMTLRKMMKQYMTDESKTHLVLSSFFMNILRLNAQINC